MGKVFILVTLAIGVAALNTGNNLLYLVLAALLSIIISSGILSEQCLRHIDIRRLGADAAFAQEVFPYRYSIETRGTPVFALIVEEVSNEIRGAAKIAYLPARRKTSVRADLMAPRRGPYSLTAVRVTTVYPLGLFAKSRTFNLEETLWVFPKRISASRSESTSGRSPHIESGGHFLKGGSGDLLGLRQLGDLEDATRVHWKKSASVGKLLTIEREREYRPQYLLEIKEAHGQELESICEQTAARAHSLLSKGYEVGLRSDSCHLRPSAGPYQEHRILSALATLGFEDRP